MEKNTASAAKDAAPASQDAAQAAQNAASAAQSAHQPATSKPQADQAESNPAAKVSHVASLADAKWADQAAPKEELENAGHKEKADEIDRTATSERQEDAMHSAPVEVASTPAMANFSEIVAELSNPGGEGESSLLSVSEAGDAEPMYGQFGDGGSGSLLLPLLGIAAAGVAIALIASDDDNDKDGRNDNQDPAFTSPATATIDENASADTIVLDANVNDPDGDDVTFALTGTDADAFTINEDTGEIRLTTAADFESQDKYTFTVKATDENGGAAEQAVTITVNDVNEAPMITLPEAVEFDENVAAGTSVLLPTATDPDDDMVEFSLTGDDADSFDIDAETGEVTFVNSPDFEMQESYDVTVVATDPDGMTASQDVTISINDLDDATPDEFNAQLSRLAANLTGEEGFSDADEFFYSQFTALNGSGVSGVVLAGYDEDTNLLTVTIQADGLEAGQVHPQHIHGFMEDDGTVMESMVPTIEFDDDGDGFIELAEAADSYGPVLLSLMNGDNFPTANADGSITFTQTYDLPKQDLGDDPMLALREVVLHGMSLEQGEGDNGGEADGTVGYKATLPVAAGALDQIQANDTLSIIQLVNAFADNDDFATQFGLLAATLSGEMAFEDADRFFMTPFTDLNDSGVSGIGIVGYDEDSDTITVSIQAEGLEPGQVHPQHIHGFMEDDGTVMESMVPTIEVDDDSDGFIELAEAADSYGPVLLSLMTGGDFPTADADGSISFTRTYQLPQQDLGEDPMLSLRELVLHGMTLQEGEGSNGGEADGTEGYKATLPVAAGALDEVVSLDQMDISMVIDAFAQSTYHPAPIV